MSTVREHSVHPTLSRKVILAIAFGVVVAIVAQMGVAQAVDQVLLSGTVDSSRATAPKWTSTTFTPTVSGTIDLELSWTGGADLAMDVRRVSNNGWVGSNTGSDSPKLLSVPLEAGVQYRLATWARSGVAAFDLTLLDGGPPPTTTSTTTTSTTTTTTTPPGGGEVVLMRDLDATWATAPGWVSTNYTAAVTGPITLELDWSGSADVAMDVRRVANGSWVASNTGSAKPKTLTVPLDAGVQYRFAVWARSGTTSAELFVIGDAPPPTTTTTSTSTTSTTSTTTSTTSTSTTSTTTQPPVQGAPNIVVINVDDARVEALEVMPKTMDWFGLGGTNYVNAYVSTPSCCPSRATLMTGQYVHNNGQINQNTEYTNQDDTIQRWLSDAGYFTSHSGKFLHYVPLEQVAPHWDRWTYFKGGYNNVPVNFDGTIQTSPNYSTIMTFDSAIEHAESFDSLDDSQPFYLHIAPVAPHKPLEPEPQYANAPVPTWNPSPAVGEADRSDKPPWVSYLNRTPAQGAADREGQLRMMMTVDDQIDRLMTRLTELGEADNTIAIFTSDNGYFWSEHGRNSKFLPYNEVVEVPFLVRWPNQIAAGATSTDLVSHVDILPTVLAAAGVTPGHVVDGRNILDAGFTRSNLLTEYWEDAANANFIPDWSSIRNESRVYTEYYNSNGAVIEREFYDLTNDPWELVNLLGDGNPGNDPDTSAVAIELQNYRTCSGSACQ